MAKGVPNKRYTGEFKQRVVETMIREKLSYKEAARQFEVSYDVFCVDGLTGFREAINAAFPKYQIQRCIVHQIRSFTKYVNWKDRKEVIEDLKKIYGAVNEDEAMQGMTEFRDKWAKNYPSCVGSWEENWNILTTFLLNTSRKSLLNT